MDRNASWKSSLREPSVVRVAMAKKLGIALGLKSGEAQERFANRGSGRVLSRILAGLNAVKHMSTGPRRSMTPYRDERRAARKK